MRKRLILSLALLGCLSMQYVNAENYFKAGTEWIGTMHYPYNPSNPVNEKEYSYKLEESEDPNAPGLLMNFPGVPNLWIKTEGEKVYFMRVDAVEEQWYLLFDFDMQPGESEVYHCAYELASYNPSDIPYSGLLVCESIDVSNPKYDGWETIQLKSYVYYDNNDLSSSPQDEIWIKGIGSRNGPLSNFYPEVNGGAGFVLEEVRYNGKVIFKTTSGIAEITEEDVPSFSIQGNELIINSCQKGDILLYAVDGTLVSRLSSNEDSVAVNLPAKGIYIVKIGNYSRKIVL